MGLAVGETHGVLFAERANEFYCFLLSKPLWGAGAAKASVKSANSENNKDPKRDELAMGRMNSDENRREVRTSKACNPFG